jgi:hypothetical protein
MIETGKEGSGGQLRREGPHRRTKAKGIEWGEDGLRAQVDLVVTSVEGGDGADVVEGQPARPARW